MKKRTKITIIIFAILGIGFGVIFGVQKDPRTQELRNMGVRAVFEDEEKFAQELQKDGLLYAYGKVTGNLKKEDLDLSLLEYRGEDREEALEKALKNIPDVVGAAYFASLQAFFKMEEQYITSDHERESRGRDYEYVKVLDPDIHDSLFIEPPKFQFMGQEFETPHYFFFFFRLEYAYWTEDIKEGDYAIFSKYIPDTEMEGLLELEIKDGKVLTEKMKFYKDGSGFNDFFSVRELAGESNFFYTLFGSILFMAMLCGITIWIQNKIWG